MRLHIKIQRIIAKFHIFELLHKIWEQLPKYAILNKITFISEIIPHLTVAKRGFVSKFDLVEIVNAIPYTLKTCLQREYLTIEELISEEKNQGNAPFREDRVRQQKETFGDKNKAI